MTYLYWLKIAKSARSLDKGKPIGSTRRLFLHENGDLEFRHGDYEWRAPARPGGKWSTVRGTRDERIGTSIMTWHPDSTVTIHLTDNAVGSTMALGTWLPEMAMFRDKGVLYLSQGTYNYTRTYLPWNGVEGRDERTWSYMDYPSSVKQCRDNNLPVSIADGAAKWDPVGGRFIDPKVVERSRTKAASEWLKDYREYHKMFKAVALITADTIDPPSGAMYRNPAPEDFVDAVRNRDVSSDWVRAVLWYRCGGSIAHRDPRKALSQMYSGKYADAVRAAAGCYSEEVASV